MKTILGSFALLCGVVLLAGCASTDKKTTGTTAGTVQAKQKFPSAEAVLQHDDVKGKPPTVYEQSIDKTHQAALRALGFVGCEIKVREPYYVAGRRPNKFGLLVGSGGETVEVFLYPISEGVTHVWVDTDLSFVGMAGQQGWNKQVLEEMTNLLTISQ